MQEATESQSLATGVEERRGSGGHAIARVASQWLLPSPAYGKPGGMKRELWPLLVGAGYVALIALLGGLRGDHFFLASLALLDLYNERTRRFLRAFFPFILTGVIYDFMRYFYGPAVDGRIHVKGPYLRDLRWFGVPIADLDEWIIVTPNEYFQVRQNIWLDLLCGLAYLTFVAQYLMTGFYLFLFSQLRLLKAFGWSFLSVNILGYITYFVYPAAPPWYVTKFGFAPASLDVRADPAAAVRFDQYFGTRFFEEMYSRNAYIYGAYPSLHVSYPLLVFWICMICPKLKWFRVPALCFYLLMCFSAVYLQHHYVVDILLGSLYGLLVAVIASGLLLRPISSEQGPASC